MFDADDKSAKVPRNVGCCDNPASYKCLLL